LTTNDQINEALGSKVGVDVKFAPVGTFKLSNSFSKNSMTSMNFRARRYYRQILSGHHSLKTNGDKCKSANINEELLSRYNGLPIEPPRFDGCSSVSLNKIEREKLKVWRDFWSEYKFFFDKWGTHVVEGLVMGAEYNLFDVVTSDKEITSTSFDLALGGDVDLTAAGAPGVNVGGNADIKAEKKKSKSRENHSRVAYSAGGDTHKADDMKDKFMRTKKRTEEDEDLDRLKKEFMESANESVGILKETWVPIWEIPQLIEQHTEKRGRDIAKNMELYFHNLYKKLDETKVVENVEAKDYEKPYELKFCVEYPDNFEGSTPSKIEQEECICGRSTICKKDEICNPYSCANNDHDMECGVCIKNLHKISCAIHRQCDRGQGDCDVDWDCGKNGKSQSQLKCGSNNCRTLRAHLGLPYAAYKNIDDCCYDPELDRKRFGIRRYFEDLAKNKMPCVDKTKKCFEKHVNSWRNLYGNKLDTKNLQTCKELDIK
jgi:hypothetical protein